MTRKTYAEKLKDPRWQKKRLEVLERAGWACEMCYDTESTFHVHHKVYFKNREPWEYEANQLAAICEHCHKGEHDSMDLFKEAESRLPLDGPGCREMFAYLMAGSLSLDIERDTAFAKAAYQVGSEVEEMIYRLSKQIMDQEKLNGQDTNNKA